MLHAAGMHHHGTGDHRNPAAALLHLPDHLRNPADDAFHPALGRHVVAHEREAEAVALAELGGDANALVTADHRFTGAHVAQLAAGRAAVRRDDHRIHALSFHFHPLASEPHVGTVVGRGIEVIRDAAILF